MKKFQQQAKQKAHLSKIRNAKKTISNPTHRSSNKLSSSKITDEANLLLKLYDNKQYDSIPAYKLLRTSNLQQYTKGFIERGYGINLGRLALLTDDDKNKMYEDLKVLPGHTVKLDKIIKAVSKNATSYSNADNNVSGAFEESELSMLQSVTQTHKNVTANTVTNYRNTMYTAAGSKKGIASGSGSNKKIGSSFKIGEKQDLEYEKQLERVMDEYTPQMAKTQTKKKGTGMPPTSSSSIKGGTVTASQKRTENHFSSIGSSTNKSRDIGVGGVSHNNTATTTNKPYTYTKASSIATSSAMRRGSNKKIQHSSKTDLNTKSNDPINPPLTPPQQNLKRLLKGVNSGQNSIESSETMKIELQYQKIKDLYRSFDGATMSSTIANLDIEELVYAFAGYVCSVVVVVEEKTEADRDMNMNVNQDDGLKLDLDLKFKKIQKRQQVGDVAADSLDDANNGEPIEDQIGSILRESYMHPLYRESGVMEEIECGQEAKSQGQNDVQENDLLQNNDSKPTNLETSFGVEKNMLQSSFLGGQSYQFGFSTNEKLKIFDEPDPSEIDYFKPTIDSVSNFIKNVVLAAKMERQIPVMATSYMSTFLQNSKIPLTSLNYKRILVTCLLLASKIWDDESFESPSFSKTFPQYPTILLNEMQKQMLKYLDYKLKLDKPQYAMYYFRLRKYIKNKNKSYQNRKLNIKRIRQLQNGVKKDYRADFLGKRNSF